MPGPAIIQLVRNLAGDTGTPAVFSDTELAGVCARYRRHWRYLLLTPLPTYRPGQQVVYEEGVAPVRFWDPDSVQAYGPDWSPFPLARIEAEEGRFVYAQPTVLPVFVSGDSYDVYGAAAEVCERWAARLATTAIDTSADGVTVQASGAVRQLAERARVLRAQADALVVPVVLRG